MSHNRAASPVLGLCSTSAAGAGANHSPWQRMIHSYPCNSCASGQGSESRSTAYPTHGTTLCGPRLGRS